jgi:glycosyltransferase involved in cell wall biosynthesis
LKKNHSTHSHFSSNEKRLKVLLFDNDDFSDYTSYFARGLSKYVDVILYCFSEESPKLTGAAKQKGITVNYINQKFPKGYSVVGAVIRVFILFLILFNLLMRTKYDIVHIQDYLPAFFLFIPFLKLRKKRICWTLHDLDIFSLWYRLFAKGIDGRLQVLFRKMVTQPTFTGKHIDRILVHALSHKQQLMAKSVDEKKIHVIRQFDNQYLLEFSNTNPSTRSSNFVLERNYILFFGYIAPWKGIDTLIDAVRIVKNKSEQKFLLVIAGRPYPGFKDIPFFEKIKKEEKQFVKIIYKDITSSEIPALISESSFLVLPYDNDFRYSSSGVIPLSYMFAKPVIVSNVPSLVEYVDHDKTGLIFEMNNSRALANCIIELIENNSKCLEMGKFAYQKMVNEMSLDVCCKMIYDIYNEIRT